MSTQARFRIFEKTAEPHISLLLSANFIPSKLYALHYALKSPFFSILLILVLGEGCSHEPPSPRAFASTEPAQKSAQDSVPATVDINYLLGKFDPATRKDFVAIGKPYSDKPGMMLRIEAFESFKKMFEAAEKDGITLKIISSERNFDKQKDIWESKWARFAKDAPAAKDRALKILEYSAMPGASRHHWGTDVDLNDLNNPSFEKNGRFEKAYAWLTAHAHEYGFCQPYTAGRSAGYREEKWHWSYTPLSKTFLEQYKNHITDARIKGFKGDQTAAEIGILKNYVLGINPDCH